MGYSSALEAAGCTILAFEKFGSYQGDWWAKVQYDGAQGWIHGSYGSCSGCDAFEAEFGWGGSEKCPEHEFHYGKEEIQCVDCRIARDKYLMRLADFGRGYLPPMTQEEAEKAAAQNIEWDSEVEEMVAFVKGNACA